MDEQTKMLLEEHHRLKQEIKLLKSQLNDAETARWHNASQVLKVRTALENLVSACEDLDEHCKFQHDQTLTTKAVVTDWDAAVTAGKQQLAYTP